MTAALFRLRLLIDRLSMRERVLALLSLVVVLSMFSYAFLWQIGWDDQSQTQAQIEQLQTQTMDNREALLAIEQTRNSPQLQALGKQNDRLRQDIEALDDRISAITDDLIPPETMATLLRELLGNSDLTLVRFTALPALPATENDEAAATLYQHRLDIELTGNFDALARYLETIETLPWQLFWDELSVETTEYPTLRIQLKVHTLSDQEEWLNV
jgi:MSHA biogenesis protein MshJ